ncbi:MAG: single-stranded DNA-binding protein [Paraclostridium sp.]
MVNPIIVFHGRLGKDPNATKERVFFSVAVDVYSRGEFKTKWIGCTYWNNNGTNKVINTLKKGAHVNIVGHLNELDVNEKVAGSVHCTVNVFSISYYVNTPQEKEQLAQAYRENVHHDSDSDISNNPLMREDGKVDYDMLDDVPF